MKKALKILIILLIVAAIVALAIRAIKHKKAAEAQIPPAKQYALVVKTMHPSDTNVTLTLPALAESTNEEDVTLAAKIAGRVLKIVKSGDRVRKGDLLVRLDTTQVDSQIRGVNDQIAAARIALRNLLQTHKRTQALYAVKGASIEQLQQEESKIAQLRAQIQGLVAKREALRNTLTYATITAPVGGVVSHTFASTGSVAMPGKPLVSVSAKRGFSLIVRLPRDIQAQAIRYRGKTYPLVALESSAHGLRAYKAYVDSDDLSSGDRVGVSVILFHGRGILLPFTAILDREGKSFVVAIEKGKATPLPIHPLLSGEEGILVSDRTLVGKRIALGQPDMLLRLLSGVTVKSEE